MKKSKLFTLSILLFSATSFNVAAMESPSDIQAKTEQVQQTVININNADAAQLATLKGIGKKRAQAIIEYRDQHGKFTSLQDLLEVKGVGSAFLQANQGLIKI